MTKPTRVPRMLAVTDIAELMRVSTRTVRRWIDSGDLRVHRLGRQVRVSEEDLAAFLNQRRG
jgi:excisionase family DNA binding protein